MTIQARSMERAPSRPSSRTAAVNDAAGLAVVAILALAPIPFGSNRPFFWALWALVAASALAAYLLRLGSVGGALRVPLSSLRLPLALFAATALAMLVQLAPVGRFVPLALALPGGAILALETPTLSPGDTWFALLRWLTYGILFVLALQAGVQRKRSRIIARALALIVAAEAAYALVALAVLGDTILVFGKTAYLGVATGTFINRNSLATFLGIGAVLCVSQILGRPSEAEVGAGRGGRENRVVLVLALLVIAAALLATQSRMGLLASTLGIATVVLLQRGLAGRAWAVLAAMAVAAGLAVLYGQGVIERALTVERNAESRGQLYEQVLGMIADRPLLGYGAGAFRMTFPLFHDPGFTPGGLWDHTHSTYLALWSGLGVVAGTLPMLLVAGLALVMARQVGAAGASRGELSAALGATVLVAVHALVDFSLEMQAVAMLYTVVLALGAAKALPQRAAG